MLAMTKTKQSPIGIDIRDEAVYAAQYSPTKRGEYRLACARIPLDPEIGPLGTIQALEAMCRDFAFKGNSANISMANTDVDIRKLLLPEGVVPNDSLEFQNLLRREARSVLTYEPEEAMLDYLPLGCNTVDGEKRFALLLIAARRDTVHHRLALLHAAGIRCTHLEPLTCAIVRAMAHSERVTAILDFGKYDSTVSIVKESKLLFSRAFKFGLGRVVDDLSGAMLTTPECARLHLEKFGIRDDAHAHADLSFALWSGKLSEATLVAGVFDAARLTLVDLVKEVRRSTNYFTHHIRGGNVDEIVVISSMKIPGLEQYLAAELSLPTKTEGLWSRPISDSLTNTLDDSSYAGAIGLATRSSRQ